MSDSTSGASMYCTVDGSTPTTTSPQYLAPFQVASFPTGMLVDYVRVYQLKQKPESSGAGKSADNAESGKGD